MKLGKLGINGMILIGILVSISSIIVSIVSLFNGTYKDENKRAMHNFGNNLVKNLINKIFQSDLKDIMTGYRVFNKKFVKNMPINSNGFEIETEMTLHTLDKKFLIKEIIL